MIGNKEKKQIDKISIVYGQMMGRNTNIFLCGGASTKGSISIRDRLRNQIESEKNSTINILYPEDLLISILNRNKDKNLLDLENFLAQNSDHIIIVAESAGSFVELGAFVNNKKTVKKVIALIKKQYRRDKSFIMLGPISLLENLGKDKVIYYEDNKIEQAVGRLKSIFREKSSFGNPLEMNTLVGLSYYILLLLHFYSLLSFEKISSIVNYAQKASNIDDIMIRSSLKFLFQKKWIIKNMNKSYELSMSGKKEIRWIMGIDKPKSRKKSISMRKIDVDLYDSLKFDIMYSNYYP